MSNMFVENFKSNLPGGGARANLFEVSINFSGQTLDGGLFPSEKASFLCKAASIPASDVASIPVPFRGREIKVAGDRTFQPWTITVINDTDFAIRGYFEAWSAAVLNSHVNNIGDQKPISYKSTMEVKQLNKTGNILRVYEFVGCWCQNISEISLDYSSTNTIEEFTAVIEYDYWTAVRSNKYVVK